MKPSLLARYGEFATRGADLTFATDPAANSGSECQIQKLRLVFAANISRFSMAVFSKRLFAGGLDEDFAFAGVIGLPDDAFFLHALHQ